MTLSFERSRVLAGTALLLAVLAAPAASAATAEERAAAREHLTQGQDLKRQGKPAEALAHLQESQRLDPKLMTLVDIADLEEQLGKLVEAQAHWAAARDRAQQDSAPRTKQRAEERLVAVEKRVAHLTLQLAADAPPSTQVFRDEALLDAASLGTALAANPGDHAVLVKAPGHDDAKYAVKLAEGDNQTLPIAAGPATAAAAPPPPPPKPAPTPPPVAQVSTDSSSWSGQRTAGLVLGGVGAVGAGVGGYLWAIGARDANSLGPTADRNLVLGKILVVSGVILFGTGVVLFVTAPSANAKSAQLTVTPVVNIGTRDAFLGAAGTF